LIELHPALRTPILDLFGIDVPILSAGMGGGHAGPALASSVSEAGALGGLGGIVREGPQRLSAMIRRTRDLTSRPFSVNLWLFLLDVAPAFLDVCIQERVPSVTLSFGDPTRHAKRARDAGLQVIYQAQTVAGVRQAAAAGVDAIIAQGGEAGGHTGSVATFTLVPQAVDAAGGIPVIAAGGIADGRGLVAALALGAQGAVMGTRFICASESEARDAHREKIIGATADDTVFTEVFDVIDNIDFGPGIAGRTIRTPFSDEWHGREDELRATRDAIMLESTAPNEAPERAHSFYAGQSSGLVRDVKPAGDIVRDVIAEAELVLNRLNG
jgi:NAD(P)H-dependent flavin oxidoreductase YrpB (nitropropane dioxygenase family)